MEASGIYVNSVVSGSPADEAGIKAGDIVSLIEGLIPASDGTMADYCKVLRGHTPDDPIAIEVFRSSDDIFYSGTLNTGNRLEAEPTGQTGRTEGSTSDRVYALDLIAGACFNFDDLDRPTSTIALTDRAVAHDSEVYAVITYPLGSYPGDTQLYNQADSDCLDRFADYVGVDYDSSQLWYFPLWATESQWDAGDRKAVCALSDLDGYPRTGSVYHNGY